MTLSTAGCNLRKLKTASANSSPSKQARTGHLFPLLAACLPAIIPLAAAREARKPEPPPKPQHASDESVPGLLTLNAAKRIAYEHNWDLLAAQAGVDLAVAQKIVAREFPNPTLSWSTQKVNTDSHPSATTAGNSVWNRNYDTIFAVNQLFEIGGKRTSRQQSAAAGIKAAEAALLDARRTLNLGVSKAYIGVLLADGLATVLEHSAETMRHEREIAQTRFKAGDVSESDRMQIEIAAARLELDARAARSNTRTARIALEVLLGAKKITGSWQAVDTLLQVAALPPGTGNPYTRPDLQAARELLKKSEADLKLQKAMRVPDPTFLLQYEHQAPDQPNTVGFGFSLPLPLWNHNGGNIKAAEAARRQAEMAMGKIESQVASDVATADVAYAEATSRWAAYQSDLQAKSAKVLETVQFAYKKGGASLLDLFAAQRTDNDVRTAAVQAMADRAVAAVTLAAARNGSETKPKLINAPTN